MGQLRIHKDIKMRSFVITLLAVIGSGSGFRLADTRIPQQRVPNSCVTQSGSTCVFPFRYKGIVYTSCATVDQASAWCSTEVDAGGNYVTDKYGFCPSSCPASSSSSTTTTTTTTTTLSTTTTVSSGTSTTTITTTTTTTTSTTTTTTTTTASSG